MRVLVIGDIHGREFWKDAVNDERYKDLPVIFLGDYCDGYSDEWEGTDYFWESDGWSAPITDKGAHHEAENLLDIMVFKKQNPDRVTLLIGNHDQTYFTGTDHGSRCSRLTMNLVHDVLNEHRNLFTVCKVIDGVLFSHAGATDTWLSDYGVDTENIEASLNNMFDNNSNAFFAVGRARGGWHRAGSITWADMSEHKSDKWKFQVFGHTQLNKVPFLTKSTACVDVRRAFVFDTETFQLFELDGTEVDKRF